MDEDKGLILTPKQPELTWAMDQTVPQDFLGADFVIENEDPTIGMLLQHACLQDPRTVFAGCQKPHPLDTKVQLKLVIRKEGRVESSSVLADGINNILHDLEHMKSDVQNIIGEAATDLLGDIQL